ncbi:DUF4376 domain-containing protein [Dongia sp.]|uniref:DUF4376 domain-containing protein n=1 Tax=Dongia sp. TaxID=1977262 RepID=UPI0035AE4983
MQRFFIDAQGYLIGSYDGPDPHPFGENTTALDHGPTDGRMRWDGTAWCLDKSILLEVAAEKRWRVEQGGTTWNSWALPTDDRSQSKYQAELAAVNEGVRLDGDFWKFPHGFEPITNTQIRAMAIQARQHVLGSFAHEAQLQGLIMLGQITTPEQIENWEGWQ